MAPSLDEVARRAVSVLRERPSALITDIDGTLSRIAPRPEEAIVSERARAALRRIVTCLDRVAVITGRELVVARRMVGVEGVTYVASYALGDTDRASLDLAPVTRVREAVRPLLARWPCVQLEEKDVSFALHYRNCKDGPAVRQGLLALVQPLASHEGAKLLEGKQVIEVAPRDLPDKGEALLRLVGEEGIRGAVFIGDDLADAAAFRQLRRRAQRLGVPSLCIAVVDAETEAAVRDAADIEVHGVDDVERLLELLAEQLVQPS